MRGTIIQFALDNLAAHSIFGFTEMFSGCNTYVSRYCECTGAEIQNKVIYYCACYYYLLNWVCEYYFLYRTPTNTVLFAQEIHMNIA